MGAARRTYTLKPTRGPIAALGVFLLLFSAHAAQAQEDDSPVDVIERSAQAPLGSATGARPGEPNNLSVLFYEMQLLQNEVMKLRGELEQLGHRLDEVARRQSAQYLDMDRRLQGLGAAPLTSLPADTSAESVDTGTTDSVATSPVPAKPATEEDAYRQAFALIEERKFEQAVGAYDQFLIDYPNGEFTPNAFYWLGELHLRLEDLEKSRQSFVQVLTLFPENRKVPDALYKLGVVYDRLGDHETAGRHLQQLIADHPGTTATQLAIEYQRNR